MGFAKKRKFGNRIYTLAKKFVPPYDFFNPGTLSQRKDWAARAERQIEEYVAKLRSTGKMVRVERKGVPKGNGFALIYVRE